jgi:hypothetical protein
MRINGLRVALETDPVAARGRRGRLSAAVAETFRDFGMIDIRAIGPHVRGVSRAMKPGQAGDKTMTHFAAYDDLAIYALGATPEAAISKAREDCPDDEAEFRTAKIGKPFAAWIEANGWDAHGRSFDVIDGELVDTTDDLDPLDVTVHSEDDLRAAIEASPMQRRRVSDDDGIEGWATLHHDAHEFGPDAGKRYVVLTWGRN